MTQERLIDAISDLDPDIIDKYFAMKNELSVKKKLRARVWVKWGAVAACFCLVLSLGVGVILNNTEPDVPNQNNYPDVPNQNGEPTGKNISVHSLEELSRMREMLSCTDEAELDEYLMSVEGGADSKEDISRFIAMVDSIPYVGLIDGDISWISYSSGQSKDTGDPYEILYITTEASNGDWTRFEYRLSVTDVSSEVAEQINKLTAPSQLSQPVISNDKKVTFFSETREAHVSGTGDVINWIASIDGIYTNIVYYTSDADMVDTATLLSEAKLSSVTEK